MRTEHLIQKICKKATNLTKPGHIHWQLQVALVKHNTTCQSGGKFYCFYGTKTETNKTFHGESVFEK